MNKHEVISRLKAIEPEIRAQGVEALYLYGSYSRDEARPDSDIDILVDFEEGKGRGLTAFMAPYETLSEQFPGIEIGYSTREGIVPLYLPYIENSAIRVF